MSGIEILGISLWDNLRDRILTILRRNNFDTTATSTTTLILWSKIQRWLSISENAKTASVSFSSYVRSSLRDIARFTDSANVLRITFPLSNEKKKISLDDRDASCPDVVVVVVVPGTYLSGRASDERVS